MKCTALTRQGTSIYKLYPNDYIHEIFLKFDYFLKVSAKLKEEKDQQKLSGKKKSKQRESSPQDENREQLFDVPAKKTNGVKETGKTRKSGGEESDDLK